MDRDKESRRQFVSFTFFRLLPDWRRLPQSDRTEFAHEFEDVVRKWASPDQLRVLTYSLQGMRADCDFMLWRICFSLECMNHMTAELMQTGMAGYVEVTHSMLATTRRSQYTMHDDGSAIDLKGGLHAGTTKYLHVYPLNRTRQWYILPFEERRRMVREISQVYLDFPESHVNVCYSFGLDDADFVIAIETNHPLEMVERIMRLRETDSGPYIERDQPVFTCLHTKLDELMRSLGG
jgi:chlorite dismutase